MKTMLCAKIWLGSRLSQQGAKALFNEYIHLYNVSFVVSPTSFRAHQVVLPHTKVLHLDRSILSEETQPTPPVRYQT